MKHFLVRWILMAAAIMVAANLIDGIYVDGWGAVLIAALVLGIINAVIRPILILLTLPLNLLTLGLLTFVINGLMLKLVAAVVSGFEVVGIWPAVIGAVVLSVVSTVLNWLVD